MPRTPGQVRIPHFSAHDLTLIYCKPSASKRKTARAVRLRLTDSLRPILTSSHQAPPEDDDSDASVRILEQAEVDELKSKKEIKLLLLQDGELGWPEFTRMTFDSKSLKSAGIGDQTSRLGPLYTDACGYPSVYMMFHNPAGPFPPVVDGVDTTNEQIASPAVDMAIKQNGNKYHDIHKRREKDFSYKYLIDDFVRTSATRFVLFQRTRFRLVAVFRTDA